MYKPVREYLLNFRIRQVMSNKCNYNFLPVGLTDISKIFHGDKVMLTHSLRLTVSLSVVRYATQYRSTPSLDQCNSLSTRFRFEQITDLILMTIVNRMDYNPFIPLFAAVCLFIPIVLIILLRLYGECLKCFRNKTLKSFLGSCKDCSSLEKQQSSSRLE